jgi:tRNA wybutosine-synthesizing protein 1
MITKKNLELLKKQHYIVAGKHSAVQICRWTKHSLVGEGECYKHKFYGIPSWRCCEISPAAVWCDNHCLHCWRAIEATQGNQMKKDLDEPQTIIDECLKGRRKLLTGFGGHNKLDRKRYQESHEPSHFAISLIGEPTLYPKIGELVAQLRKLGKTSFIVTNGLHPETLKKLEKKKQLPTQLYISLNSSNQKEYEEWHRSRIKNAWKKYNETLDFLKKITGKGKRTVLRMTLVKGEKQNMDQQHIEEFAEIIKKSGVMYVEVKSYMSLGYARARMGYDTMPTLAEIQAFAKKLAKASGYLVLDKHIPSRIVLLGKNKEAKRRMKITKREI